MLDLIHRQAIFDVSVLRLLKIVHLLVMSVRRPGIFVCSLMLVAHNLIAIIVGKLVLLPCAHLIDLIL